MAEVSPEVLHFNPEGSANPISATYAHVWIGADKIVHEVLQEKQALLETSHKETIGVDIPMPAMDENWSQTYRAWTTSVQVDLPRMREYAHAVVRAVDTYLASLSDADLDRTLPFYGEDRSVQWILSNLIIGHINCSAGEIAVLKGIQGLKGYPF